MATTEQDELASLAGFTVSFFKANSELWGIFQQAIREDWAPDRLLSRMRNTNWFKKTNQTQREALLLQRSDPAEYQRRLAEMLSRVKGIARQVGIPLGGPTANRLAVSALHQGLNDLQIRETLGSYGSVYAYGARGRSLSGETGRAQEMIREAVKAYGISVTSASIGNWLSGIAQGLWDEQYVMNEIRRVAKSTYPGLAEQIDAGQTVRDFAEPYIEAMARTLEMNPADITLNSPEIRQALSTKDRNGKITSKTVWQFEEDLRKDPRWLKTNNARESLMAVANKIGQDFGLVAS